MARPDQVRRVLLDASCLIGVIKGEPEMRVLQSLLGALDRGDAALVESTAIFAEVLPQHPDDPDERLRGEILALLESPDVELVDVSIVVAKKAAQLRVAHGLKTWDAIHLPTAIVANVDVVFVRDDKFPQTETIEGVFVSAPYDIDDDKLFSDARPAHEATSPED